MEQRSIGLVPFAINPIMPGDYARCTIGERNGRNKNYFQKTLDIYWGIVYYINCKDKTQSKGQR
jgi:hypothetical protein